MFVIVFIFAVCFVLFSFGFARTLLGTMLSVRADGAANKARAAVRAADAAAVANIRYL